MPGLVRESDEFIDLFDHRRTQALNETARRWRRESPVTRIAPDSHYVARWHDCWAVLRDAETFANGNGFKAVELPDDERMLIEMDPPLHPPLRRVVRTAFARKSVEAERPFARASAARLLDALVAQAAGAAQGASGRRAERRPEGGDAASDAGIELVESFTDRIANLVNFHLMGFPTEDTPRIVAWAREILHSEWTALNRTEKGEGIAGAFPEFARYVDDLVDSRSKASSPDDLIARLVGSEVLGRPLSRTMLRTLVSQIILGGISTSTNLLGSMLHRLLTTPGLHARLRAEPALVPAAVEESLRLDPPVLFVRRVCRRDTELAGTKLAQGETVIVGIASANRDEAVFEDADAFRLDRGLPRHIAFAGGAHLCSGAALARLVACETISAYVARFEEGELELVPGFVYEGVPVFLEHGPKRLDVRLRPSR
ncbi:MAG: cytochrome P450 [Myxococcota bacterium]